MPEVRPILDRLADLEATIDRVSRQIPPAEGRSAMRMALQSLEARREELLAALNDVAAANFIDICDYRLLPERESDYSINMVTQALRSFQDMVTSIYDAITTRPKMRGSWDAASIVNSSFSFGYSYTGSLGIVLMIPNERLIGEIESNLDRSVMVALEATKTRDPGEISKFAQRYGLSAIRYLYQWSKVHADHAVGVRIKWRRQELVRYETLEQFQDFREFCNLVERGSEPVEERIPLRAELLAFDAVSRRFRLGIPDSPGIRGSLADEFDATILRTIHSGYQVSLTKRTIIRYATSKEDVSWTLVALDELK